jgi:hypothetical protein
MALSLTVFPLASVDVSIRVGEHTKPVGLVFGPSTFIDRPILKVKAHRVLLRLAYQGKRETTVSLFGTVKVDYVLAG